MRSIIHLISGKAAIHEELRLFRRASSPYDWNTVDPSFGLDTVMSSMQPCSMKLWLKILICVLVITLLGGAGAIFTSGSLKDWYAELKKPPGVPPNWLFGPVWTVLYAMMGISLARIWHFLAAGPAKTRALLRFAIQMVLNLAWTPIFFGAHLLALALTVIVALWIMILLTIFAFKPLDRLAAILLIPYLVWVSYATYLNVGYLALN